MIQILNKKISFIIHCAAQPSHDWAARNPFLDYSINSTGTLNILDVILLLDYILDNNTYSLNICVGDLNYNFIINITDIVILLNLILDS